MLYPLLYALHKCYKTHTLHALLFAIQSLLSHLRGVLTPVYHHFASILQLWVPSQLPPWTFFDNTELAWHLVATDLQTLNAHLQCSRQILPDLPCVN